MTYRQSARICDPLKTKHLQAWTSINNLRSTVVSKLKYRQSRQKQENVCGQAMIFMVHLTWTLWMYIKTILINKIKFSACKSSGKVSVI